MLQIYGLQHFVLENVPKKAILAAMERFCRSFVRGFVAHLCYFGAVLSLVVFNHPVDVPFVSGGSCGCAQVATPEVHCRCSRVLKMLVNECKAHL